MKIFDLVQDGAEVLLGDVDGAALSLCLCPGNLDALIQLDRIGTVCKAISDVQGQGLRVHRPRAYAPRRMWLCIRAATEADGDVQQKRQTADTDHRNDCRRYWLKKDVRMIG